jgi:hypothetical protein
LEVGSKTEIKEQWSTRFDFSCRELGIAGTAVLVALFFISKVQGNPITGRGGPITSMSLLVEIFQGIFIARKAKNTWQSWEELL